MKGEKCIGVLIGPHMHLYQYYDTSSVARQIDGKPYLKKEQRFPKQFGIRKVSSFMILLATVRLEK